MPDRLDERDANTDRNARPGRCAMPDTHTVAMPSINAATRQHG